MAEPINKLAQFGPLGADEFRPRYAPPGLANMQNIEGGSRAMSTDELMYLLSLSPWVGAGGLAGRGIGRSVMRAAEASGERITPNISAAARWLGYSNAPAINKAGRIGGALGGAFGADVGMDAIQQLENNAQTAENQPGGFYGPSPQNWLDAEGQPGGFYGNVWPSRR